MACIGIDLGTTHACVGVSQNGKVNIIANDQGFRCTPCYVSFAQEEPIVGSAALEKLHSNTSNTVYHLKRILGKTQDELNTLKTVLGWTFDIESSGNVKILHNEADRAISAEEFCSIILTNLKELAEDFGGETVEHAVLTVPAHYSNEKREILRRAAVTAKLNVLSIITDPMAAAIAYGLDKPYYKDDSIENETSKSILVFDLGGATHDVSILTSDKGLLNVVATVGNDELGGEDFTNALVDHCLKTFKRKQNIDITDNQRALCRLRFACERAKRTLSQQNQVTIDVDTLAEGQDLTVKISQARYEDMIYDLVKKAVAQINLVLEEAQYEPEDIDEVLMVGGASRVPCLIQKVEEFFNGTKKPQIHLTPDEVVATGATIEAISLLDTIGHNLELLPNTNEDHMVDVVPLTIGIEVADGTVSPLIHRESVLPVEIKVSVQAPSKQKAAWFAFYEGERLMAKDNQLIATCGLESSKEGGFDDEEEIELSMNVNKKGLLRIVIKEKNSEKQVDVLVQGDSERLSKEQVDKIVEDAEAAADEDDALLEQLEQDAELNEVTDSMANVSVPATIDGGDMD